MPLPESLNAADLQPFLDNPGQLAAESGELQLAIANYPATPRQLLEVLIRSTDLQVAQAARLHVNWAGEILENWQEVLDAELQNAQLGQNDRLAVELLKFAPVPDCFFSEWVPAERFIEGLRNPYLPLRYRIKFLERLAQEPTLEPRLQVAELPETPLAVLEQLAGDLEIPIRLAVKYNSNCPPELIELVEGQHSIASDWNTDAEQLATLGQSRWAWIRLAVTQNPSTPAEMLMQLAGDSVFKIQLAVAKNPQTPGNVLAVLAEYPDKKIQEAVAEHPNASEEMLHQLFPMQQDSLKRRKNLPASILERFFREGSADKEFWKQYELRDLLLRQPNTPTEILGQLANTNLEELRAGRIANSQFSPDSEILESVIQNDLRFLVDIAKHPQVSREILERLSQYSIPDVQLAVAKNLKTPQASYHEFLIQQRTTTGHVLEHISNIVSDYHRAEIALHPQVLVTTLEQLAGDSKPKVRLAVALNNKTSNELRIKLFEQLATENFESIRAAVAGDSRTPVSLLEQICINVLPYAQSERLVCAALIANPNTPTTLKIQLIEQLSPVNPDGYKDLELRLALRLNRDIFINQQVNYIHRSANSVERNSIQELAKNPNTPVHILELLAALGEASQGLSQNPYTPAHILRQLAQDASPEIHRAIANNPATTVDILVQLASQPGEKTSNHVPKIRECVLNHPNLPLLERYRLLLEKEQEQENEKAREFMSRRPNSPYALVEVLNSGDKKALYNAARHPQTPVHILEQLAKHPDETVRCELLDNRNLPLKIRLELTRDPSVSVRCGLARKNSYLETPIQVLEELALDESEKVRAHVAANSDSPIYVLQLLADDSSAEVCQALTRNPSTPEAVLEFLGTEKGIVNPYNYKTPGKALAAALEWTRKMDFRSRDKALENLLKPDKSQMPASVLEQLSSSTTSWVRSSVAFHRNTPTNVLARLAYDDNDSVRAGVAENPNTSPESLMVVLRIEKERNSILNYTICHNIALRAELPAEVLEELARNENEQIRRTVAERADLPQGALEWLVEHETHKYVLLALASNPNLTVNLLNKLAQKPNTQVRIALLQQSNLTPELWIQLAEDETVSVREAVATHYQAPEQVLELLSRDEVAQVRMKVAANPNTLSSVIEVLAGDESFTVRAEAATHPNITRTQLEALAGDEKVEVRRAVAINPNTPSSIRESLRDLLLQPITRKSSPTLRGLSRIYNPNTDDLPTLLSEYVQSPTPFVRFVALLHPLTSVEALQQNIQSLSWIERYAVADNPSTPSEIRRCLTQDSNCIVRAAAKSNLSA